MFCGVIIFVAILQSTFTDGMTTAPNKCSEIEVAELDKIHQKMEHMLDKFEILRGKIDLLLERESNLINKNELLIKDLKIDAEAQAEKLSQTVLAQLGILNQNIEKQKLNDLTNSQDTSFQEPKEQSFQNPLPNATHLPKNCTQAMGEVERSGVYQIDITNIPFTVYCENYRYYDDNIWLIIQRRQDESVNFDRKWTEYQHGFGDLNGNFFFGLDKIHALTQSARHELWIKLESFEGATRWAKYDNFSISNESDDYRLKSLGTYTGDAGDSLSEYINQKWFISYESYEMFSCAQLFKGTWWYNGSCGQSNLNLPYFRNDYIGIFWKTYKSYYPIKYTHMAIRPVN